MLMMKAHMNMNDCSVSFMSRSGTRPCGLYVTSSQRHVSPRDTEPSHHVTDARTPITVKHNMHDNVVFGV